MRVSSRKVQKMDRKILQSKKLSKRSRDHILSEDKMKQIKLSESPKKKLPKQEGSKK